MLLFCSDGWHGNAVMRTVSGTGAQDRNMSDDKRERGTVLFLIQAILSPLLVFL